MGVIKFKLNRFHEEEIIRINDRLTDYIIYFSPIIKKSELINLLDKLNKLRESMSNEIVEFKNQITNMTPNDTIDYSGNMEKQIGATFLLGKIDIMQKTIEIMLEKIKDIEKQNQSNEVQEEIIEKSKHNEDINYLG